jgi:hypothetical protein
MATFSRRRPKAQAGALLALLAKSSPGKALAFVVWLQENLEIDRLFQPSQRKEAGNSRLSEAKPSAAPAALQPLLPEGQHATKPVLITSCYEFEEDAISDSSNDNCTNARGAAATVLRPGRLAAAAPLQKVEKQAHQLPMQLIKRDRHQSFSRMDSEKSNLKAIEEYNAGALKPKNHAADKHGSAIGTAVENSRLAGYIDSDTYMPESIPSEAGKKLQVEATEPFCLPADQFESAADMRKATKVGAGKKHKANLAVQLPLMLARGELSCAGPD